MLTRPPRRADDGAVAVFVAVVVVAVVLPLLALVVDLGLTRTLSAQSSGAADAAALAAASDRPTAADPSLAIAHAQALVAANLPAPDGGWAAAWASCLDPAPLPAGTAASPGDCISLDYILKQVRVRVPGRPVPSVFAGAFGSSPPEASATSTATWGDRISPAVGSCALCVRGTYSGGAARVLVNGGDAATNVVTVSWQGLLQVTVPGGGVTFASAWYRGGGIISPLPVRRPLPADAFAPGLATLRASAPYGRPSTPGPNGPCTPGTYQTVSGCTSFSAGTYYVTGNPSSTQQVSLNAEATDVVLFFTCSAAGGPTGVLAAACPSGRPPRFNGAGNGPHTLAAPGRTGLALVFDAGLARNEYPNGGQQLTVAGDVYGPDVTLRAGGTRTTIVRGRVGIGALTGTTTYPRVVMLQVDAPPVTSTGLTDGAVRLVRSG